MIDGKGADEAVSEDDADRLLARNIRRYPNVDENGRRTISIGAIHRINTGQVIQLPLSRLEAKT
jgi:hypothetical protein